MKKITLSLKFWTLLCLFFLTAFEASSQIIISQYYEGTGTNKWVELTNTTNAAINTASPQLKLGLWAVAGSTGNIALTGAASNTVNLTVTIPAYGSVLIGNTGNGTEISYLTAGSAAQTSNAVINFNGNDGVALLDASNNIIDAFGTGINATDISYVRNIAITSPSSTYVSSQWSSATISVVQTATTTSPTRLNFHLSSLCVAPTSQPSGLSFGSPTSTSVSGSFTATTADEYLVVYSTASTLTALPTNGTTYTTGNTFGNATVVSSSNATTFTATGLTPTTTYYFSIFALNNVGCNSGPAYKTTALLNDSATTIEAPLYHYFGNFHAHSEFSDGTGLPSSDFTYGDTANCMDFLGISEHNHVSAGMSLSNWIAGKAQAAAANTSTFLAMYGMEWGVISGGGHVIVYGVDDLLGWDSGQYQTYVPQSVYTGSTGLFSVINSFGNNAFATLAHPNNADYNGIMSTYNAVADDAIVGSAVENGPSTSTNTTYSNPPAKMAYLSYYRNMLARGYHLGPTIDHDNHNVTHGHTATSRTVVMSPSLSQNDILSAMRLMRFYASEDCGAYVTFKINNLPIGSITTMGGTPTITVTTSTTNPVTSLKIYSGVPGSGSNATILTSTTSGSITYTHAALTNLSTRYYYIDITESDGNRIVTAPIWYTRNDAARNSLNSAVAEFFAIAEAKKVSLKWITNRESINQTFTIEKSTDNDIFEPMETQLGKGISPFPNNYTAIDDSSQNDGITYYRLTQFDAKGDIAFTETRKVMRNIEPQFDVEVSPNPVSEKTTVSLINTNGESIQMTIYDLTGQLIYNQNIQSERGNQEIALPLQDLKTGIYLLTMRSGNHIVNTKISKL